jgi:hypothetical protein
LAAEVNLVREVVEVEQERLLSLGAYTSTVANRR